jgi:hypothetical protein
MSNASAPVHAGRTRRRRLLASGLLTSSMLVVFLVAVAPPAFAVPTCNHAGTTDTVSIDSGNSAIIGIDTATTPDNIIFDGDTTLAGATACGDVTNTTLISVTGSTGNETFVIDLSGGAFPAAINFQIDMAAGTDALTFNGSSGADTIEFGANGVDLDNDDAADVTDPTPPGVPAGVETFTVNAAAGNDTVTGVGSTGAARPGAGTRSWSAATTSPPWSGCWCSRPGTWCRTTSTTPTRSAGWPRSGC